MTGLDTLVVKFAAPCNLNCTYCYEYAAGDSSWQLKPKMPSLEVIERLGVRIREFGRAVGADQISLVAHGGEPLLIGAKRLDSFFERVRALAEPVRIRFSIQTNGTLLTEDICEVLEKHHVLVGVSLDGGRSHNARRVDHHGMPTWDRVVRGIELLRSRRAPLLGGILCVVNLEHEPEEVIDALCGLRPPQLDLLQPFITHDSVGVRRHEVADQFGEWMIRAMGRWLSRPEFSTTRIRVFEDALRAAVTRRPTTDWFGPRRISYLVVETDGAYDLLDQLKIIGASSAQYRQIRRSIFDCSLSDATVLAWQLLEESNGHVLPRDCRGCRWADVCAGGHLTARHSRARGFDNKAAYCEGILALLDSARQIMVDHAAGRAAPHVPHTSRMHS